MSGMSWSTLSDMNRMTVINPFDSGAMTSTLPMAAVSWEFP